ncbi:hypothetical protein [Deinococcus arenicola]|uniref:Uncharacterized protein n=1 Tax=Deinococcus arenicola TaxID=2994950 RepID=A0ABU4DQ42_9DEIO|nr:hypothetical protein [Deinococcus sp. ZS9-10]MDV6374551.1 hypothetical protein [Deinococcus sp. ZS9-10]
MTPPRTLSSLPLAERELSPASVEPQASGRLEARVPDVEPLATDLEAENAGASVAGSDGAGIHAPEDEEDGAGSAERDSFEGEHRANEYRAD